MPTRTGEPTAVELAAALSRKELSSRELAACYLDRIESVNAILNAAIHVDAEATLGAADAADRALAAGEASPLLGLPISIKDSIAVARMPCQSGSYARAGYVPTQDATVVRRLRAAGAIVLCKTNVPEYTWSTETENAVFGRTVNPYDTERTCGGSSGGEAALHAVDASPVGVGTDGLCSIRIPCHFCGTVGLRPTVGLIPETGVWPTTRDTGMLDMSTVGPMGRAVEDLALVLGIIAGPDDVDPFVSASPVGDYRSVAIDGLRIGFYTDDGLASTTLGTRSAVERAARTIAELGADVEATAAPPLGEVPELAFHMMAADGGARAQADLAPAGGRHVPQMTWLLDNLSSLALSAAGFFELMNRWIALRSRLRRFVARYDVVLCPVAAGPAPLHGHRPSDDSELTDYGDYGYSFAYAVAGVPAAVLAAGSERGLPVGVQIVAPAYHDHVALAVAAALEEALVDALPPPPLFTGEIGAPPGPGSAM